jgi:hypothetical protein
VLEQPEGGAKLVVKRVGVVSHHVEAAAFRWTARTKVRYDYATTLLDCTSHLTHVRRPIGRRSQEVENCSIMPNIVATPCKCKRIYVAAQPIYQAGSLANPCPRDVNRGWRQV